MTLQEYTVKHGHHDFKTGELIPRSPFKSIPDDARYILHATNGDVYGCSKSRKCLDESAAECSALHVSTRKQYNDRYDKTITP